MPEKCPKCPHDYKDPAGGAPGELPCLEIVKCAEPPGSTICGCRDPWHSQTETPKKYTLSICAIVKDENVYLPEWIAYHLAAGVEHFYIYDNGSKVPIATTLAHEVSAGVVTVIPYPGRCLQMVSYNDCMKRFAGESRWIAIVDADEFIVPKGTDDLRPMLVDYQDFGSLAINWQVFGSSGFDTRPPGLQLENFLKRAPRTWDSHRHVKCIVQPEKVSRWTNPHFCVHVAGAESVNEQKAIRTGAFQPVTVEKFQVNHYYFRSRQEYREKNARGVADTTRENTRPLFELHDKNHNVEEDRDILRFVPRMKDYLASRG